MNNKDQFNLPKEEWIAIHVGGTIIGLDQNLSSLLGYDEDELVGKSILDIINPDDRERAEKCFLGKDKNPCDLSSIKKDKTIISIRVSPNEIKYQDTLLQVVVIRDLSGPLDIERESEKFFNLANEMLCIGGPDGHLQKVNPAFTRILGWNEKELLSKPFIHFVHPDYLETTTSELEKLAAGKPTVAFENLYLFADGSYKYILWTAYPEPKTGLMYAVARDVTKEKKYLQELLENKEKIQAILNTTVDGIMTINEKGSIESFNAAAEHIFGYSALEIIGQNVRSLMPEPYHSEHNQYINNYVETRVPKVIGTGREVQGRRKNGEIFPMDLSVSEVSFDDGSIFTGIIRDITKRKQAAEALRIAGERLQKEVDLAVQIQTSLLPEALPELQCFEIAARALPARFVSGDFYDYVTIDENNYQVVLADISGKGIPAAFLAMTTRALMRSETEPDQGAAELLAIINDLLYDDLTRAGFFITLFTGHLNQHDGELKYASAGHGEALLWKNIEKTCVHIQATGLPIGVSRDALIEEKSVNMLPGDIFIVFSDGITEAINSKEEQYGIDRLLEVVEENAKLFTTEITDKIIKSVETYIGEEERQDDISLVALKAVPRTIEFTFPAKLDQIDSMLSEISKQGLLVSDEFACEVELACSEVITNIILHAYQGIEGLIKMKIKLKLDKIAIEFYDQGKSFEIDKVLPPAPETIKEGGYGLDIVRQIMDEVIYKSTDHENNWKLIKYYSKEQN